MSARTPFIPSASGPPSQAAHRDPNSNAGRDDETPTQFIADYSNPLHSSSGNQQSPAIKTQPKEQLDMNVSKGSPDFTSTHHNLQSNGAISGPLNISGMIRRANPHSTAGPARNLRNSSGTGNTIVRPGTADPNSRTIPSTNHRLQNRHQTQSIKIHAPSPRTALRPSSPLLSDHIASGVFSISTPAFKAPTLPITSTFHISPGDRSLNDAHIPVSTLGFSFSKPKVLEHSLLDAQQQSGEHVSKTLSLQGKPAENDNQTPSLTLNMSLPDQTGPQRILADLDAPPSLGAQNDVSVDIDRVPRRMSRHRSKRSRADVDKDDEHDDDDNYEVRMKKHRSQPDVGGTHREDYHRKSRHAKQSSFPPQHTSSPGTHPHCSGSRYQSPSVHSTHHEQAQPPFPGSNDYFRELPASQEAGNAPPALDKLLGRDTDLYVEEHMDVYERAMGRWMDCSMSEWVAGADELALKYGEILDFVKAHMTTKMKLYAKFDNAIETHNTVLDERERLLAGARDRLVEQSGHVLGAR